MAQPTTEIVRWDLSLTFSEFVIEANRRMFAAHKLLPPIMVGLQNAKFRKMLIENLLTPVENTRRAPDGTYRRDTFEWGEDSYATEEHGVEEPLDDRQVRIYRDVLRAEQIAVRRALNRVLQKYEDDVATYLFNATTFAGKTAGVGASWKTSASTADPIADIDAGLLAVENQCGVRANTIAITKEGLRLYARTARVEDLVKYSGRDDPKSLAHTIDAMKAIHMVENVVVCGGQKNTAGRKQDASLSKIWDESMCLVCNVNDGPDLESDVPSLGRTIVWADESAPVPGAEDEALGVIVEEYYENARRGNVYRARTDYVRKTLQLESGYLLTGIDA